MTGRSTFAKSFAGAALAAGLAGCAQNSAPSLIFAGSYFPLWMACALAGVLIALALRMALGRAGLDRHIAFRLAFYVAIALLAATGLWLLRARAAS